MRSRVVHEMGADARVYRLRRFTAFCLGRWCCGGLGGWRGNRATKAFAFVRYQGSLDDPQPEGRNNP